jgi:hypothetical protein
MFVRMAGLVAVLPFVGGCLSAVTALQHLPSAVMAGGAAASHAQAAADHTGTLKTQGGMPLTQSISVLAIAPLHGDPALSTQVVEALQRNDGLRVITPHTLMSDLGPQHLSPYMTIEEQRGHIRTAAERLGADAVLFLTFGGPVSGGGPIVPFSYRPSTAVTMTGKAEILAANSGNVLWWREVQASSSGDSRKMIIDKCLAEFLEDTKKVQ